MELSDRGASPLWPGGEREKNDSRRHAHDSAGVDNTMGTQLRRVLGVRYMCAECRSGCGRRREMMKALTRSRLRSSWCRSSARQRAERRSNQPRSLTNRLPRCVPSNATDRGRAAVEIDQPVCRCAARLKYLPRPPLPPKLGSLSGAACRRSFHASPLYPPKHSSRGSGRGRSLPAVSAQLGVHRSAQRLLS